ncbi:TadE/TadG family type IV pilus assembly protein [Bacillus kwashiorkori]|uniref:TadE/TadG family type IV pilus assembly protein n=1 Tax=Bacillus kwashiorkori TaxID=1522318 RepID=UPI000783334E|nr:hypothetical protein [Bacillus kwashiorkori]
MKTHSFFKDERGAFTLEASLLFPIILILSLTVVFFFIVLYLHASTYHTASMVADRMVYSWNNSDKDIKTAEFSLYTSNPNHPDGLYWRLFGNNFLDKFGIKLSNDNGTVTRKINRINSMNLSSENIDVHFDNTITGGKVTVTVQKSIHLPNYFLNLFGLDSNAVGSSVTKSVHDPVELIRTTDFVFHYTQRVKDYFQNKKVKSKPEEVFNNFAN